MGLVERLNELESMRQSGQISDSEYAMLVASATKKFSEEVEPAKASTKEVISEIGPTHTQSKNLVAKPKLIGVGAIAILVVGFLIFGGGGSGDKPSITETEVSETLTTGTVSDDVKFRKNRIKLHLEGFKRWNDTLREWNSEIKFKGGESSAQIQGPVRRVYSATEILMTSVIDAFDAYPELAGEGRKVNQVLRELQNIYLAMNQELTISNINFNLERVEQMWPTVVEGTFQWEKALQKLIDESP
jgi:hypothetical protein